MSNDVSAIVTDTLYRNADGITARKLAGITSRGVREVNDALTAMEAAGTATRTPGPANGNRKGADVWTPATPTNPGPVAEEAVAADDTFPDTGDDTPDTEVAVATDDTAPDTNDDVPAHDASDTDEAPLAEYTTPDTGDDTSDTEAAVAAENTAPETNDALPANDASDSDEAPLADDAAQDTGEAVPAEVPLSDAAVPAEAPVSGAPVVTRREPDLKVLIMAGVLGDHPDGVTAAVAISESGLAPVMGDTILAAMEVVGAARRLPVDEDGVELWVRGDGDLATVDPAHAPTHVTCPTCGHVRRIRRPSATARRTTGIGRSTGELNGDGSEKLGKNGLRNLVEVFMRNLGPGHEVTPHTVGQELGGRSPGACNNALNKLTESGVLIMTSPAPVKFALVDNPPAPTPEVLALMTPPAGDTPDATDTDATPDEAHATPDEAPEALSDDVPDAEVSDEAWAA